MKEYPCLPTREALVETLKPIADFSFEEWKTRGTGSAAELTAGKEFADEIRNAWGPQDEQPDTLKL